MITNPFRRFMQRVVYLAGLAGASTWLAPAAAGEIDLSATTAGGRVQKVTAVIEVRGDLTINADGQKVRRVPLEAKAELRYVEKFLPDWDGVEFRTARHYATAATEFQINKSLMRQTLRDSRRLVVAAFGDVPTLYCPAGPLTREEVELIDVPGSSACMDLILPGKQMPTGGTWNLSDTALSRLLALEVIGEHKVSATLTKVEEGVAIIDLTGKVTGAVGGVSTEIDLQGKANFHLGRKTVSWLALQYDERRAIGHAQPGYEAKIRVRVEAEPVTPPPQLDVAALSRIKNRAEARRVLLEFKAESAGIEFLHDRRWRVMVDRFDTVILRLVDRGELIAQCNITRLPSLAKGEQLSLAAFQKDVEQTLGKNLGQIVEASQSETSEDLRVLRVTVAGTASELPIQWIYYQLSDAKGNRASLVFTMESKLGERFAGMDRELIDSVTLSTSLLDETKEPHPAATKVKSARRQTGEAAK